MRGDIYKKAKALMSKYKTNNPYELAKCLDIQIYEFSFEEEVGMYRFLKKNKVIILSDNLDCIKKKFVLAHELGHAVLHAKENCFYLKNNTNAKVSTYERDANKFASEILINDDEFCAAIEYGLTLDQMSSYFEVPGELINYKIDKVKLTIG